MVQPYVHYWVAGITEAFFHTKLRECMFISYVHLIRLPN